MAGCTSTWRPNSSNCNLRYVVKKVDNEELVYFCRRVQLTGYKLVTFIKQFQNLTILFIDHTHMNTGALNTNRTCDLPLRRGLLYPLSYQGDGCILR
jgi:hypothetical protein